MTYLEALCVLTISAGVTAGIISMGTLTEEAVAEYQASQTTATAVVKATLCEGGTAQ